MARPKVPLIDRREVLLLALRIVDDEGLDALTVRRLATELGVNNTSLYHHFENKDAILTGVAGLIFEDLGEPAASGEGWRDWIVGAAVKIRRSLNAHPTLMFVVQERGRLPFVIDYFDRVVQQLGEQGVPPAPALALIESLDAFAIGTAAQEVAAQRSTPPGEGGRAHPHLVRALQSRALSADEQFLLGCRQLIDGIVATFGLDNRDTATATPGRGGARRP